MTGSARDPLGSIRERPARGRRPALVLGRRPPALLLSLALLALVGCTERGRSASAEEDRVVISTLSAELLALDARGKRLDLQVSLARLLEKRLEKTKGLRLARDWSDGRAKREGARLRVQAKLLPDGFTGQLHALVSARVTGTGTIPLTADVDALRDGAPDGGELAVADYVAHLEKAVGEAVVALDEQAKLLHAGSSSLVKALTHAEPDVRVAAARTLGERRATEAVEPLCEMLDRERGQVGQAVIGALTMIGDERAVPCLIQWAGSEDRRVVLIVEPLSTLGGREAREYLDMLASGHDDQRIRRAAEEGLRRLESRAGRSSKAKTPPTKR